MPSLPLPAMTIHTPTAKSRIFIFYSMLLFLSFSFISHKRIQHIEKGNIQDKDKLPRKSLLKPLTLRKHSLSLLLPLLHPPPLSPFPSLRQCLCLPLDQLYAVVYGSLAFPTTSSSLSMDDQSPWQRSKRNDCRLQPQPISRRPPS